MSHFIWGFSFPAPRGTLETFPVPPAAQCSPTVLGPLHRLQERTRMAEARAAGRYLWSGCKRVGRRDIAALPRPLLRGSPGSLSHGVPCSQPKQKSFQADICILPAFFLSGAMKERYEKISTGGACAKLRLKALWDRQNGCAQARPTAVTCHEQFCKKPVSCSQRVDFLCFEN